MLPRPLTMYAAVGRSVRAEVPIFLTGDPDRIDRHRRNSRTPWHWAGYNAGVRLLRDAIIGSSLLAALLLSAPAGAAVSVRQGFSPYGLALTKDGRYGYLSFDLSPFVFKVRLSDMSVVASAEFSRYFPLQCSTIALNSTETKVFLFDHTLGRLLVLDAATLQELKLIGGFGAGNYGHLVASRWGPRIILASGWVWLIDTDTLEVTRLNIDRGLTFVRESLTDSALWYAVASSPGSTAIGVYNYKTSQWTAKATISPRGSEWGVHDFAVLPDGSKAYLAVLGPWYPDYHASGWLYAADLASGTVQEIPFDGGAKALAVSADGARVYAGAGWPVPAANMIQALDTRTGQIAGVFQIPQQKFGWWSTQINELRLDPVAGRWLYATSSDGNDLIKVDAQTGAVASILVLNEESNAPNTFVQQPGSSRGYLLLTRSSEALELDLSGVHVTRTVEFPITRTDVRTFGAMFRDPNTVLISQGEYFLELNGDLTLRARHNLPNGFPAIWGIVGSRDAKTIYSISQERGTSGYTPNALVSIDSTSFQVKGPVILPGGSFNLPWEHPDAGKLYVLGGMQNGAALIHVVDPATLAVRKTIRFDDPSAQGVSAGGGGNPYAYDPATRTLYVGSSLAILAIDTDRDEIKRTIYVTGIADALGIPKYAMTILNPVALLFHPGENRLYAAHVDGSFVSVYDLATNRFLPQVIPVKGYFPGWIAANADLSKFVTLNRRSDTLSVIDTAGKTVEKVIDIHACNPSPGRLEFTAGGTTAGRVTLSALKTTGTCTVSTSAAWLSVAAEGPSAFNVTADTSVFGSGTYRGSVTAHSAALAESTLDVTLKVGSGVSSVRIDGVVDGAGYALPVAPGGWASIFGGNLAPATRAWGAGDFVEGALPIQLEGTGVSVNGRSAAVYVISPGQINFQVPDGFADGQIQLQVSNNGALSNVFPASLRQRAPELFRFLPTDYTVALHTNNRIAAKPDLLPGCTDTILCPPFEAAPGETVVLYGTGFGATSPASPTGMLISNPVAVAAPVEVRFGSTAVSAPAWLVGAGLYQINVKVPDSLPDGDTPLKVVVGGTASTARALLTIKRPK